MKYISSDTNVWIDFTAIDEYKLPFLLPYTFVMWKEAMEDELLSPLEMRENLESAGLTGIEITIEEFYLAEEFGEKYKRLSIYDRVALAIAKNRKIMLLTGDMALRKAAKEEKVAIIGSIGILDMLWNEGYIGLLKYRDCLEKLKNVNGHEVRLPIRELEKRLKETEQY